MPANSYADPKERDMKRKGRHGEAAALPANSHVDPIPEPEPYTLNPNTQRRYSRWLTPSWPMAMLRPPGHRKG